jgi:uncharacterized membrane protein YadS
MEKVMNWFFTLCFVGLGLQTRLGDMRKAGAKGILIGYIAGCMRVGVCLAFILILTKIGIFK